MIHLCTLAMFHAQHANSLLLLIYVQVQCNLVITRNTCVNICLLNCLNLFLKYKLVRLVQCVCVLDLECFAYFVERCFGSLICRLDLCFFPFLKKLFSSSWTASQQILNRFLSIEPFFILFLTDFNGISIHRAFWVSS